jgi:hypothetical protein
MAVAIVTKYLGPTDYRGARIVASVPERIASCDRDRNGGTDRPGHWRLTIPYPYELSGEAVHRVAAEALATRLGWDGHLVGGALADGYAFTFAGWGDAAAILTDAMTGPTSGENARRLAPLVADNLHKAGWTLARMA